ncbi:glycosyltransferase family 39 protein [bacterium]|nr:glycosyltransferase family 39 protein [bacterium]
MQYKNGVYFYKLNQQNPIFYQDVVENIELISTKDTVSKIKKIDLFYGNKYRKIDSSQLKILNVEFLDKEMNSINFSFENNNKTLIQKAGVYFQSIFYNWYFYLVSYILILVILIKYQNRFDLKIKYPIALILFLAAFLRFSHIDFVPLWNDELYTLTFISNMGEGLNLKNTFLDAGNPPLFFIMSNFWLYFLNKNIILIRLLPLIIGVFQVYLIYFLLKKILSKKVALIASFLSAINIFMILESNEIRSYILSMVLVLCGLYQFIKLKNDFNNKNLYAYVLILILLINTHFYCILYVISNFILGLFLFKENRIKFFISNLIAALSFLPYFLITVYNNSFDKNFNTWLEKPSIDVFYNHIVFYFGNIIFFLLVVIASVFLFKKLEKKEKFIFLYSIYSISFVFISALIVSLLIKPILFERYFCIFLPYLIINTSLILNIDYKTKFKPLIIVVFLLFSICIPKYENFNLFSNIYLMAKYSSDDYKDYKAYESYFVIPDRVDYIKYFPEIPKDRVIVSNFGVREDVDLISYYLQQINYKKGEKIILYLPEICINSKIKYSKELNIKKIDTTIVPVYKIYIE